MGKVEFELSSNPITPRPNSVAPTSLNSVPITPRPMSMAPSLYITSAPHSQFHFPSLSRSPLLMEIPDHPIPIPASSAHTTPNKSRNITPRFLTPLVSPLRKANKLTKLDPQDAWLPITEPRNGNAYYAAFHTLSSGIGFLALVLPVAFTILGWTWGIILLTLAFTWQLYTLYLMVQLHEDLEKGVRYSRYMQLESATLGEKLSKLLAVFPIELFLTLLSLIPANGSMLTALYIFHGQETSRALLGLISLFVIINALSSFQIYAMPVFDDLESAFTTRLKKPCAWWLRALLRAFFGFFCLFMAVAMPFAGSFSGLIEGISLPVTLAYPCFMWNKIKKPKAFSPIWWLNWGLGILGMCLTVLLVVAGLYVVIDTGVKANFFKPE